MADQNTGTDLTIAEGFLSNLLDFVILCINILKNLEKKGIKTKCTPAVATLAHDFLKVQKPDKIIIKFIERSVDTWKICKDRKKEDLFPSVKGLFSGVPEDQIETVLDIFTMKVNGKSVISDEEEVSMWEYIHGFIEIGIYYIHEQRCWALRPDKLDTNGNPTYGYTKVFMKDVKLTELADLFGVKLEKPTH